MDNQTQYKPMTDAIRKHLEPLENEHNKKFIHINEANMINEVVFGQKGKGLRDIATAEQLRTIETLERLNTYFIENGMIDRRQRRLELMKFKK